MNHSAPLSAPARRTRRTRRAVPAPPSATGSVLLALSAAALALAVAGCGGSGDSKSTASNANPALEKAVKYTQCMRENGVTDFPDPDKNGRVMIAAGGARRDSPQLKKAQQAGQAPGAPRVQDKP